MGTKAIYLMLLASMLVACTSKMPYRPGMSTQQPCMFEKREDCPDSHKLSITNSNASLYVIELDDQGRPTLESQLNTLLQDLSGLDVSTNVLLFVHGWRHTAAPDDDNFNDFIKLSRELNVEVPEAKKTIGIYIGWRGQSVPIPGIDFLTFWDRKFTAHEIGPRATDVFAEIDQAVRLKRAEFDTTTGCGANSIGATPKARSTQCRFLSLNLIGHMLVVRFAGSPAPYRDA